MSAVGPANYYQAPQKVRSTSGVLPIAASTIGGGRGLLPATAEASTPLIEKRAEGASALDVKQRGAVVGEPIPIVFCRRIDGTGGVLISPPATEARFEDDASSNITASYHLVLSEGQIDSIQVRDVFQRACRVGSFTQTYDRRAGTFVPGNFINNTPNLEAPTYCGTSGTYDGLSTMAFSVTIPAGFDQWNRQVHAFIRGGIYVERLLDSVTGPSSNVADLLLYLLRNSSRVPEEQIDTSSLFDAALFTDANGFWFNGVVSESTNLRDWISNTLEYFLLRQSRIGGKEALRPLVPINGDGTINIEPVEWVFTFTEQHIIPGSFEIDYTPLADRKPFCATMLWRQQDDLGIPVMRTAEVRYTGTAVDGPYEQHDLSGFGASEDHAVKVGTYFISKRNHVTHRLQIGVKPDAFNENLAAGDLVRVRLNRAASTGADSVHDYLYEVDRIGKSITGEVQLDLTHFPVDANRVSVVAQEVNAATGTGLLLPTGLSGVTCDVNSSSDTSVPAETFTVRTFSDYSSNIEKINDADSGGFDNGNDPTEDNPEDELSEYTAGIYFAGSSWNDNVLTVTMRLAPTGKAPRESLGPLFASINSTSVVAVLPNGQAANPQPGSLPSVSFSGLIAEPWNGDAEGLPEPPSNRIFEGQFAITFYEGDFPPAAENPAQQLTYRATVEFSNWQGGFTEVSYLNTLVVDFEPTEAPEEPGQSIFYWSGTDLVSTGSETIETESFENAETGTLTSQSALQANAATEASDSFARFVISGGLPSSAGGQDFTIEWLANVATTPDDGYNEISLGIDGGNDAYSLELVLQEQLSTPCQGVLHLKGSFASGLVTSIATGPNFDGSFGETDNRGAFSRKTVCWTNPVHVAIQKIGNTAYAHVDGILYGFLTCSGGFPVFPSGSSLFVGFSSGREDSAPAGEVIAGQGRFTPGAALYGTGTFTPPTEAFYDPTP